MDGWMVGENDDNDDSDEFKVMLPIIYDDTSS